MSEARISRPTGQSSKAAATPTVGDIAQLWRARRLRVNDLPRSVAVPIAVLAGLALLTAAILAGLAFGVDLPGPLLTIPSLTGGEAAEAELIILVYLWIALASVSAAALLLAARGDARRIRLTMLLVAVVMFTFLADMVSVGDTLHRYEAFGLVEGGIASWRLFHAAGWIGVCAAVVIAVAPRSLLAANAIVPLVLGAGPYALGLVAFLIAAETTYQLPASPVGTAQALSARPFLDNGQILSFAIILLVFWQAATWGRVASRDLGLRISGVVQRWPLALWFLLTAKLAFIGAGYAMAWPCGSGREGLWTASLCDHPLGWLVAVVFAAAVCVWLLRPERLPISAEHLTVVAAAVVLGFALVAVGIVLLRPVVTLAGLMHVGGSATAGGFPACIGTALDGGLTSVVACALRGLGGAVIVGPLATVAAAGLLGVILASRRRWRVIGIPLLVFAIWALPRALDALLIDVLGLPVETVPSLGFELATFDTALSLGLVGIAIAGLSGRTRPVEPGTIVLVLVVSTLIAHNQTLIPADWRPTLFLLLLAAPLVYLFVLDAGTLNEEGADRPTRVLAAVVASAAVLTLAAAGVFLGTRSSDEYVYSSLASLLFLVPFAAIVVGGLITTLRQPATASAAAT